MTTMPHASQNRGGRPSHDSSVSLYVLRQARLRQIPGGIEAPRKQLSCHEIIFYVGRLSKLGHYQAVQSVDFDCKRLLSQESEASFRWN